MRQTMVDMVHQLQDTICDAIASLTIQRTVKMSGRVKRVAAGEAVFFPRAFESRCQRQRRPRNAKS